MNFSTQFGFSYALIEFPCRGGFRHLLCKRWKEIGACLMSKSIRNEWTIPEIVFDFPEFYCSWEKRFEITNFPINSFRSFSIFRFSSPSIDISLFFFHRQRFFRDGTENLFTFAIRDGIINTAISIPWFSLR